MNLVAEFQILSDQFALWYAFDPSVKADLFSTAIFTSEGTVLVDPIAINSDDLSQLQARAPITAIIITSQNHWRAARQLSQHLLAPIYGHDAAQFEGPCQSFVAVGDGERVKTDLEIITIEGAVPGEIAIFSEANAGSLIVGDALINVEPYGFAFLPSKYCDDHRQMRRSLRRLADREIKRMFFAHGLPIASRAGPRLRALFASE
jgi:glyoxylase-like metal-dependent hydrolase (beta-lactamase superfamily II)